MCAANAQPTIAVSNGNSIHIGANFNYGTFQRNGTAVFQEQIADFFGNGLLPSNFEIVTPQLLYDNNNNRFITADAAYHVGTEQAWITVGTSAVNPAYPGTRDCTYKIDANLLPGEGPTNMYPTDVRIGHDADSIEITANMHNYTDGKFQYSKLWVLPKSAVYNVPLHNCPLVSPNPSFVAWGFKMPDGTTASDVIPTKSHDASSSVNYLLSAWSGHGTELALWTLDTHQPSLSPGLTAASVRTSAYVEPPKGVPQKGTTTPISPWGSQLANAVYRPTSGLWTVHAVACQPDTKNSCFQWFELDPQHKAVVQSGVAGYSDASVYAPSVAVNEKGNAVFVYNSSGPNLYPSVDVMGRAASDPPNSLQATAWRIAAGLGPYLRPGATLNAPGLRTSADTDPANDDVLWTFGAYATGKSAMDCPNGQPNYDWATHAAAFSFSGK